MSSPLTYPAVLDDKDLDDAALWAMIDSATASHSSSKCKSLASAKFPIRQLPSPISNPSPPICFQKLQVWVLLLMAVLRLNPCLILENTDYTLISGHPYIKKSGWRKISCYFNISYEIRDKNIEFDENRNVQRAEFVIRAYMQGGRFSDGWGSCDRREKRFQKPNHDVPSTAETRAKNKACQDLLGIGDYRPGATSQFR
ncbi:hypothetical protein glysoja_027105 [Glycine soja]|uniref:Uncharacterized protein n=1 Tax=Glycine soja TaxID=3848 RepID=A0A0B2QTL8_GLYSO|nr:hypothetical protein glysoja_027105 [Glycine soja]